MNKKLKMTLVIICCFALIGIPCLSLVSFSQTDDPLITLSYLLEIFKPQVKQEIITEIALYEHKSDSEENIEQDFEEDIPNSEIDDSGNDEIENSENMNAENSGAYTLLELTNGQTLLAESVLEIIVRPGSQVVTVSPFEAQGIADVTRGVEYLNGDEIAKNSYCIIPRGNDGRGFKVVNEKSYILIRGEYSIG